jgi:SAM-dependent methyltransferase
MHFRGLEAFELLARFSFDTVLDVGSGAGLHAQRFRDLGKSVTTVSLCPPADVVADYLAVSVAPVDCIWACHVLEHQPNPGLFLRKCFTDLKNDGILAVTVPPLKHEIVGGHVSLWNPGLLLYHLILAGFDCSKASVKAYGYNISAIVRKVPAALPELAMDAGDIEVLAQFFPMPVHESFNGNFQAVNW